MFSRKPLSRDLKLPLSDQIENKLIEAFSISHKGCDFICLKLAVGTKIRKEIIMNKELVKNPWPWH